MDFLAICEPATVKCWLSRDSRSRYLQMLADTPQHSRNPSEDCHRLHLRFPKPLEHLTPFSSLKTIFQQHSTLLRTCRPPATIVMASIFHSRNLCVRPASWISAPSESHMTCQGFPVTYYRHTTLIPESSPNSLPQHRGISSSTSCSFQFSPRTVHQPDFGGLCMAN